MKNSIFLFSILFGLASCSKYEDGPAISLASKKSRMANTWDFAQVTEKGKDITDNYEAFTLDLQKDGDATLIAKASFGDFTFEIETDGTWDFQNNKEELELDFENDDADAKYQILRLTKNELWVREKGTDREIHLETK